MLTSFSILIVVVFTVFCQNEYPNDYHNLLNRYHELMNDELLDESVRPSFEREKEGSSMIPDRSTFHSHPSQPLRVLDGGDMRLPQGLLLRLVTEGERRKALRMSTGELRQ